MEKIKFSVWDEIEKKYENPDNFMVDHRVDLYIRIGLELINGAHYGHYTIQYSLRLKDKDGKEIYEGDIVTVSLAGFEYQGIVKYNEKYSAVELTNIKTIYAPFSYIELKRPFFLCYLFRSSDDIDAPVVTLNGNCYDNPELLLKLDIQDEKAEK